VSLYRHISACNAHNIKNYQPFIIDDKQIGWVSHQFILHLKQWPEIFNLTDNRVFFTKNITGLEERTRIMREICEELESKKLIPESRKEDFTVMRQFGEEPLFYLDRAWIPVFGFIAYGIHVNGYVETPVTPEMWIGVRSLNSRVDPGKLDNMVAGGLPSGYTIEENVIKESWEEASVPISIASKSRPAGTLSYTMEVKEGLRRDVLYIYDLILPSDFYPVDQQGEHSSFFILPVAEVLKIVEETNNFKFNINLVIIDFAIRYGILKPDHPEFLKLTRELRSYN
jgi:8-oxo-dGTP pyrophosphatase MutT (NUDIX family)